MPIKDLSLLQRVPFLSGLPSDELQDLVRSMRQRRYAKGEVIFHQEDPGSSLFIIEEGAVKIGLDSPDGREVILSVLREGDFFGELALLDGEPRSADATALERCNLLSLQRTSFLNFLEGHPRSTGPLIAAISHQVRRLTDKVYDAAFLDVQTRLARVLLKLAAGAEGSMSSQPAFRLTQKELGAMIGATRESVNKWLGFYERRGLIRRDDGSFTVVRAKDLASYALLEAPGSWL